MRNVILDTETTGLERGHRIIEVGLVEYVDRRATGRFFHEYVNPERDIDPAATEVHGMTRADLADKPRFAEIVDPFLDFIRGANLVIHNAEFDIGFIDYELELLGLPERVRQIATVTDTLPMAREQYPGQRLTLSALCNRLGVDDSSRALHGALLDAELLGKVWIGMTSGQNALTLHVQEAGSQAVIEASVDPQDLPVIFASPAEVEAHEARLKSISKKSGGKVLWPPSSPAPGMG